MKRQFWIRRGLKFFAFTLLFITLAGLAVMSLWNALLPVLFAVPVLSFGQALGLLVLSRILFGGFGRGGWGGRPGGGWRGNGHWKQRMEERWKTLTPEQREQMRQRWEARCGGRGRRWEEPKPAEPTTTSL